MAAFDQKRGFMTEWQLLDDSLGTIPISSIIALLRGIKLRCQASFREGYSYLRYRLFLNASSNAFNMWPQSNSIRPNLTASASLVNRLPMLEQTSLP